MSKELTNKTKALIDGNEAASRIAYKLSEVFAIYPITPATQMGEWVDVWASENKKNIWNTVPSVIEMQSEAGAAGTVHGALQTGSLTTTFTSSQGLLLMIPNMYKIAGELTPCVFHVAARSLAAQALSIFCDHQDVMATRQTGFAMLSSGSVQEAQDLALIAHLSTLKTRIPFVHFFDGFRTSHEINTIDLIDDETIQKMLEEQYIYEHKARALNPESPVMRGTAQNPDIYFQGREAVNKYYDATPEIVQDYMDKFAELTGRQYKLFDYYGAEDADRVMIIMGSAASTTKEIVDFMNANGEKVGLLQVRLYRPFSAKHFINAIPQSVKSIAVLDRTKEPGCLGEPLYQDALNALMEEGMKNTKVIGGRYGLSSKEFTPAMAKSIFDELVKEKPKNHFTVGINDDVTHTSLEYDINFIIKSEGVTEAIFYGLGSDGTVSANKNSIKIIGNKEGYNAQGFFVYDSKKAGSKTESHLRFGVNPINSTYLVQSADFIACHQFDFLYKMDVLEKIKTGGTFLLNSNFDADIIWHHMPKTLQQTIIDKKIKLFVIDAYKLAREIGLGTRINTIMQTCFFAIANVIDSKEACESIKVGIKKTYIKKGQEIVDMNYKAVDKALEHLQEVKVPAEATSEIVIKSVVEDDAPEFVRNVTAMLIAGKGDDLPVSAVPDDGTYPTGTAQYEKRNIAKMIPVWDNEACVECGSCVFACPHSAIRSKIVTEEELKNTPNLFKYKPLKGKGTEGKYYVLQIMPEDCTGCGLCVQSCPVKGLKMKNKEELLDKEIKNTEFFNSLHSSVKAKDELPLNVRTIQYEAPLFEFSGACVGCGEIPYLKLITQMFGDRMLVANATGCSSIFGGNLPTTPWSKNAEGRGPAWSNSLFEDNAEFGLGYQLSNDKQCEFAKELVQEVTESLQDKDIAHKLLNNTQSNNIEIDEQRANVQKLKAELANIDTREARHLASVADYLIERSTWLVGGDGWAYDIGFGGLDHVLASGKNVNILVLDTEVYSNTGGQSSKATPMGAIAKFANDGKKTFKKDLAGIAMTYGDVYVAQVAIRANPQQTIKALKEAESYKGVSIVIAYSSCIAHGIDMSRSPEQQKLAVESGYWPLFRYNPSLIGSDKNPLILDSKEPQIDVKEYLKFQKRFTNLQVKNPEGYNQVVDAVQGHIKERWEKLKKF